MARIHNKVGMSNTELKDIACMIVVRRTTMNIVELMLWNLSESMKIRRTFF
jgi:hypothetical protein